MNHYCSECQHRIVPESIYDYFKKTYQLPNDIKDWGLDYMKQKFWLCNNVKIANVDERNGRIIMKPCNNNGNCPYYRTPDAVDIIPSSLSISASETTIKEKDSVTLTATMTPSELEEAAEQTLSYSYQWYKNGRKIYGATKSTYTFTADVDTVFSCSVTQSVADNGDGGNKKATVSEDIEIVVVE